jgi:hypothetical protein
LSKGAQGKRGSVSAVFSLCRAATLSWDAPSFRVVLNREGAKMMQRNWSSWLSLLTTIPQYAGNTTKPLRPPDAKIAETIANLCLAGRESEASSVQPAERRSFFEI